MAVTFSTKFYQSSAWKDISKIVFTSPNIVSPATAGTRSHILPGQGALGLWYEDTSNMYRITTSQTSTSGSYYNYKVTVLNDVNFSALPSYVTVTGTTNNNSVLYEYIKAGLGYTTTGYTQLTMGSVVTETRVKIQYSSETATTDTKGYLQNVYSTNIVTPGDVTTLIYGLSANYDAGDTYNSAWVVDKLSAEPVCYIDFDLDKPYKITRIFMRGHYAYDSSAGTYLNKRFFGSFTIYGKLYVGDTWVQLYTGSNTTSIENTIFLTTNDNFFRYYRLQINDNSTLDTSFNTAYYALSALQFSVYNYNNTPTRTKPFYNFKTNGDADIINFNSVTSLGNNTYNLGVYSATGSGTLASGTNMVGWGSITGTTDYGTQDSIVFEVTSGEAYNCRLTAWDDVTHSTVINELIAGDHVRVSALAFCCATSKLQPTESFSPSPINYVYGPVHNRIFKGNTVDGTTHLYYGDFNMTYRYQTGMYGDYLIFKPMLYGIDSSVSYGVHDYVVTLHYSYT